MKKIINILSAAAVLFGMTACDIEEFLTREPINEFSAETYFASEAELEMYANGMLNAYMPDYTETAGGDAYNDLIATKTSTDYFRADVEWNSTRQGSWSWGFLRKTNYMLDNMDKAKEKVSEEIYNHYEGVARFWRAYNYFSRLKTFSDIPWVEHYVQPSDTAILYGARDDREYVFHKISEDLDFACENVMNGKFKTSERSVICKDIVEAFASRFYLYEASFRQNVKVNPATNKAWTNSYETVKDLYEKAQKYAKDVIDNGGYKLVKDYPSLFISDQLLSDEVIWGKTFLTEVNGRHSYTRYFHSSTLGQQYSGTKDLVRMFLKTDGTPISDAEAQQSITTEFNGRDSRLGATVLGPGRKIVNAAGAPANETIDFTFCKTGYQIVKWCIPDESHFQNSIDESSIPVVRYPEVLLNYAEAVVEGGYGNAALAKECLNATRHRAAFKTDIPLTVENVQRERRVEFAFECKRHDDLRRRREMHEKINNYVPKSLDPVLDLREDPPTFIFIRKNAIRAIPLTYPTRYYYDPIPGVGTSGLVQNPQF